MYPAWPHSYCAGWSSCGKLQYAWVPLTCIQHGQINFRARVVQLKIGTLTMCVRITARPCSGVHASMLWQFCDMKRTWLFSLNVDGAAGGRHLQHAAAELVEVGADAQLDVAGGGAAGRQPPPQHRQQPHIGRRKVEDRRRHFALQTHSSGSQAMAHKSKTRRSQVPGRSLCYLSASTSMYQTPCEYALISSGIGRGEQQFEHKASQAPATHHRMHQLAQMHRPMYAAAPRLYMLNVPTLSALIGQHCATAGSPAWLSRFWCWMWPLAPEHPPEGSA